MSRSLTPLLALGLAACGSGIAVRTGNPPLDPTPTGRDSAVMMLGKVITGLVDAPQFANAHWGILIVDPTTGDTIYSRNAGKLFMPASNQKIITGAVALAKLGTEWRWRTPVVATGPVVGGVLRGDLTIAGSGDPSISDRVLGDAMLPLRAVADSLAARGVKRIAGRVLAVGDAFPDSTHGFGWAWDDFEYGYSAGVDELLFNEGITRLVVTAGTRAGDRPALLVRPALPDVGVHNEATTVDPVVPAGGDGEPRRMRAVLETVRRADGAIMISGAIPVGDSATLTLVHRDPSAAFVAAMRQALADRGIVVEDRAAAATTPASDTVAVITSPTLAEIMPAFEKPSQNQIGEMLFKTLGRHVTGVGTSDSGRRVIEAQLAAWGIQPYGFVVRDGSGLSRHDYVTPATLVQVLDIVRRDSALAAAFIPALPVAGVDGTLASRMRGTPAAGNARAKTGYIDRARSLSGYVTTRDGRTLVFSLLANNWTTPLREIERVQDEIVTRLATLDLGPIPPKR
jgi:D-alanyl-D-alanine carboxypeptidase/D-alanyl-D-alanine-endopeptidase (penicillin-binding protein 4)